MSVMSDSSPDWVITYRSIVLPKHCDHYGHMNVRFYAEHFDDGGFQMWQAAGVRQSDLTRDGMGIVVANISIDFILYSDHDSKRSWRKSGYR